MADVNARTELNVTTGPIRGSRKIHVEGKLGTRVLRGGRGDSKGGQHGGLLLSSCRFDRPGTPEA